MTVKYSTIVISIIPQLSVIVDNFTSLVGFCTTHRVRVTVRVSVTVRIRVSDRFYAMWTCGAKTDETRNLLVSS